ncbi:hypothetical protein, partial [uncultured Sphingomonas sp.]|uniref:hypothetical protein n=1 Tax=uncultured Sphingomonas sp. TaxID=158754 RepID=UPI00258339CD
MVALNALSGHAAGGGAAPSGDDAAALTAQAGAGGTFDAAALATRLTTLAQGDPQRAGTLRTQVEARLTAVERGELARALDAGNDNGPAPGAASNVPPAPACAVSAAASSPDGAAPPPA